MMTMKNISEQDEQTVALLIHALDSYLDPARTFVRVCLNLTPDEKKTGTSYEQSMIDLAFTAAGSYLFFAIDQLIALRQVLAGGLIPAGGCYTLMRASAELSVRSSWLTDPEIGRQDRVGRGLSERLNTVKDTYRLWKHEPGYEESGYERLRLKIVREAKSNGVPVIPPQQQGAKEKFNVDPFPLASDVVDQYVRRLTGQQSPQTWFYALLSLYVHSATLPAMLSGAPELPDEQGRQGINVSADIPQIAKATDVSAALHAQALGFMGRMVSRDDAPRVSPHDLSTRLL